MVGSLGTATPTGSSCPFGVNERAAYCGRIPRHSNTDLFPLVCLVSMSGRFTVVGFLGTARPICFLLSVCCE